MLFSKLFLLENIYLSDCVDQDQTAQNVQSDLDLHNLQNVSHSYLAGSFSKITIKIGQAYVMFCEISLI